MGFHTFLVPDYYPAFSCKCGACRTSCCQGWGISLSQSEYFRLIGMDCSDALRRRLDTAFHRADSPSKERFVLISPKWDGDCPLHGEDGLCMLQKECGEAILPAVCRAYPRAMRGAPVWEACISASCEHTLELLFASDEPLRFIHWEMEAPENLPPLWDADTQKARAMEREAAIAILCERTIPFEARLARLCADGMTADPDACRTAISLTDELIAGLARTSRTLTELASSAVQPLDAGTADFLRARIPSFDVRMEKLFVNHLFYKQSAEPIHFTALASVFAVCKRLISPIIADGYEEKAFIDALALLFRVIEHSDFDLAASAFLHRKRADTPESLAALIAF